MVSTNVELQEMVTFAMKNRSFLRSVLRKLDCDKCIHPAKSGIRRAFSSCCVCESHDERNRITSRLLPRRNIFSV